MEIDQSLIANPPGISRVEQIILQGKIIILQGKIIILQGKIIILQGKIIFGQGNLLLLLHEKFTDRLFKLS